jgi:hypothetical protein
MHHKSAWGPGPERECGDEVHILGKKIEPVWPFLDGLHECMRGHALETQQNTMGTLSDTMMLTLFMQSTEYTLGFRA